MTDEKQTTNIDIQPETNKRARYSAGMRLNATDLTTDQTYFLGKDYSHNQSLHGYGTVHGLEVSYVTKETDGEKNLIKVAPGMGIDRLGRAFTVDQVYCADLDAFLAQKPSGYKDGDPIYVVGYYAEKAEDERPVAALLGACGEESSQGGSAASRVVDSFCLKLMATRPEMPLWEATRVFYDGLNDPMKLDETYRQWVKEKLPNLRKEEAETLGQTDGAAILLGKVVLQRDDDSDESDEYPRAEENDRPYLLHTQLIQGLRGGNATEDSKPVQLATLELKSLNDRNEGDSITIWLHTDEPLAWNRNSLVVYKSLLNSEEKADQIIPKLETEPFTSAWRASFARGSLQHGDLLTFEFDPLHINYGLEEGSPKLAEAIKTNGLNFLGYDGQKIRQYFIVEADTRRVREAVRSLRTVPFVTITPLGLTNDQAGNQLFELWFHLDAQFADNRAWMPVNKTNQLPGLSVFAERPGPTEIEPIRISALEAVGDYRKVFHVQTASDNLLYPASLRYLRFVFDLSNVVVKVGDDKDAPLVPIYWYMRENTLQFEGYWLEPGRSASERNPGSVVVYVRNLFEAQVVVNVDILRDASPEMLSTSVEPTKPATSRKRAPKK